MGELIVQILIVAIPIAPFAILIRRGWKGRHIDGWHLRAAWVRRLQGEE